MNEIYNKYSILNPSNGEALTEYKIEKKANTKITKYYLYPKWISNRKEDEWIMSKSILKLIPKDMDLQIYYDIVYLGISDIKDRPRCKYCNKEAKFQFSNGYYNYCKDHRYKYCSELISKALKGRPLSEENKRNISLAKKGKPLTEEQRLRRPRGYKFSLSEEAKRKISISKRNCSRKCYKSGIYHSDKFNMNIKYLSSYELDFIKVCEISKVIKGIEIPEYIPYEYLGRSHSYYPDFTIILDSGIRVLIEVKPKNLINDTLVIIKKIAAIKWCYKNNYKYLTITESEIYKDKRRKLLNKNFTIYDYII